MVDVKSTFLLHLKYAQTLSPRSRKSVFHIRDGLHLCHVLIMVCSFLRFGPDVNGIRYGAY